MFKTRFTMSSIDWYSRHFSDLVIFSNRNYLEDLEKFEGKNLKEKKSVQNLRVQNAFLNLLYRLV